MVSKLLQPQRLLLYCVIVGISIFAASQLNCYNPTQATPLHFAAKNGSSKRVLALLEEFEPNVRDNVGQVPLHYAAISDNFEAAEILLEHGADVDAETSSTMAYITMTTMPTIFHNETPLIYAAGRNSLKTAKILLEHGADVNARSDMTPLLKAARYGYAEMVELLMANGADHTVLSNPESGGLAIHFACSSGNTEIVKFFLNHGHDINERDAAGKTLLHWTSHDSCLGTMEFLIEQGAMVNAKDENGYTPLHLAALFVEPKVIKLLIDKGAEVNAKNNQGKTPLQTGVWTGPKVVKLLLELGADANIKNNDGETAWDLAHSRGHFETAAILKRHMDK